MRQAFSKFGDQVHAPGAHFPATVGERFLAPVVEARYMIQLPVLWHRNQADISILSRVFFAVLNDNFTALSQFKLKFTP